MKYNWINFPGVILFLKKVSTNTLNNTNNKEQTNELISYLEDYLYYLYQYGFNLSDVTLKLHNLNSLNIASNIFNINDLNLYRQYVYFGPNLVINDNTYSNELLTKKERTRLNMYAGLSHLLIDLNNIDSRYFSKIYNDIDNYNTINPEYIVNNGWQLLDKVLSEELAEKITYASLEKERPLLRIGVEKQDYFPIDNSKVISNLEMYRMFDNIIPKLSKTLNICKNQDKKSYNILQSRLLKIAANDNLSRFIINNYMANNNEFYLYALLYLMGLLNIEKEASFGITSIKELKLDKYDVSKIFVSIDNILTKENVLNNKKESNYEIDYKNIKKDDITKSYLKKLITKRNI